MTKEQTRLFRTDGKRPDGLTLVPWTMAVLVIVLGRNCHVSTRSARETGAPAEIAASRKEEKYASIGGQYLFAPVAVVTLDHLNTSTGANALPIWEERSPQPQAMTGKELFCAAESFGAGATLQHGLVA